MTYQFVANNPSNFHTEQPSQDPSLQDILGEVTPVSAADNVAPAAASVAPAQTNELKEDTNMKEMMNLVKAMKEELQKLMHHINNARVRYDVDIDEFITSTIRVLGEAQGEA